jgi:hemolysin III
MKKINLEKKIELIDRSLGAEIFSAIVNGIGAALFLTGLILCIVYAAKKTSTSLILCAIFYGVAMFLTYLFSCLYHSLKNNNGKRVFRALTISGVDVAITASILMFAIPLLSGKKELVLVLGTIVITLLSIIANIIHFDKYKYVRIIGFLFQTVLALITAYLAVALLPHMAFVLMLVATLTFLAGFVFHIFGYQLSYLNSVGHIIILTGNVFLFFAILLYVI